MQANGQKIPRNCGEFLNDVRQAAYTIRNHMERNFGEQEQTVFPKMNFFIFEGTSKAGTEERGKKRNSRSDRFLKKVPPLG